MSDTEKKPFSDEMAGETPREIFPTSVEPVSETSSGEPSSEASPLPDSHVEAATIDGNAEVAGAEPVREANSLPAEIHIPVEDPMGGAAAHPDYKGEALKIMRKGADTLKWGAEEARKGANILLEKSRKISFQAPNWMPMPHGAQKFSPRADFSMQADRYEIAVELPGLERADVQVKVAGGEIVITGEKRNGGEEGRTYFVQECQFGRFERSFSRPHDADPTKIEARFEKNVLKVMLPKFPEAVLSGRDIDVTPD